MNKKTDTRATLAAQVAQFVSDLSFDDLPEEYIRVAERAVTDTVGVALAGLQTPVGRAVQEYVITLSGFDGNASLIGDDVRVTVTESALANCTFAHALDFDDDSLVTHSHPSAVVVPMLLSYASTKPVTGRDLITAYVAGVETQYHLAHSFDVEAHLDAGWHTTATLGTFGAATAAAHLSSLSLAETEAALNIASSMPAGLTQNFGTMVKPLHAGFAARSGLTAMMLAARDVTADSMALSKFGSLYMSDNHDTESGLHIEDEWLALADPTYHLKKYPCCGNSHAAVAGVLKITQDHNIDPEEIETITVTAPEYMRADLPYEEPTTGLQAKFSMEYTVAKALLEDGLSVDDFTDETVDDPDVEALRQRVVYDTTPEVSFGNYDTIVELESHSGTVYQTIQREPPGTHKNPLTKMEIRSKFINCASKTLDESSAQSAFEQLWNLSESADVSQVWQQLQS